MLQVLEDIDDCSETTATSALYYTMLENAAENNDINENQDELFKDRETVNLGAGAGSLELELLQLTASTVEYICNMLQTLHCKDVEKLHCKMDLISSQVVSLTEGERTAVRHGVYKEANQLE
ncbi:UNVERIFIED_CONTAM: hypothetical protein K2H54_037253 [Gekko kuhli]